MNSRESIFLPVKLRNDLRKQTKDSDQLLSEKQIEPYGHTSEFPPEDDYEAWAEAVPEQVLDAEVRRRPGELKSSKRDRIKKYVSEE